MNFTPKSEQEINEENLIPDKTVCDFEILEAKDTKSKKNGADMIELKVKVFHGEGFKIMSDWLLEAMAAKLRHFCEATNLMKEYQDGSLKATHCHGVCGKLKVKLEPAGEYKAKNSVRDYVVAERAKVLAATQESGTKTNQEDSEMPF